MLKRHAAALITALALAPACGAAAGVAVDGALDCEPPQLGRDAGIQIAGADEPGVVDAALASWLDQGARLVELPEEDSWVAIINGREVAIAYPERQGDDGWIVHDVQACADPETGPAPIDGELDCASDARWSQQGSIDPTIPGAPTPEAALQEALVPFAARHGGQIVLVAADTGSLAVNGREQVVAHAVEIEAGGWVVTAVAGCDGYE